MWVHGRQIVSDNCSDYESVLLLNIMVTNSAKYVFFILILCLNISFCYNVQVGGTKDS